MSKRKLPKASPDYLENVKEQMAYICKRCRQFFWTKKAVKQHLCKDHGISVEE
jgi:hypothetical protein